jgi:Lhr-like helicase
MLAKIGFHPVIRQWFNMQFAAPSPPQNQGWPSIAKGTHTLILAPTGIKTGFEKDGTLMILWPSKISK